MDDGCWMMLMVDGWKRQRGIFLMLHCSPVGDGSGWPFSGTGGLETWPGGFCGGGLTLTTRGQGTDHTHLDDATIDRRLGTGNMAIFFPLLPSRHVSVRPSYDPRRFTVPGIFLCWFHRRHLAMSPSELEKKERKKSPSIAMTTSLPKPTTSEHVRIGTKSVQEQTGLCILHHPRQPFLEILPRHGAAPQHIPPMRLDLVQPQRPQDLAARHAPDHVRLVYKDEKAGP